MTGAAARLRTALRPLAEHLRLWRVALFFAVPFLLAAAALLTPAVMRLTRYDAAYFTDAYRQQYVDPQEMATAVADALNEGDDAQLPALMAVDDSPPVDLGEDLVYLFPHDYYVGLRRVAVFDVPNAWIEMNRADVDFASYLFANRADWGLVLITVEHVDGRWVFVPPGPYTYLATGGWLGLWYPFTLLYLIAAVLWTAWVYVDRKRKARRRAIYPNGQIPR